MRIAIIVILIIVGLVVPAQVGASDVYIVQPGDTLSEIAWKTGHSVSGLVITNHIANPDLIWPGQRIMLGECPPVQYMSGPVEFALAQAGKPYVWGAVGPDAYDCSGLVQTAYANYGYYLPRVAFWQYWATMRTDDPRKGDLIFYGYPNGEITHVGIYLGDGTMVHCTSIRKHCIIEPTCWYVWIVGYGRVR